MRRHWRWRGYFAVAAFRRRQWHARFNHPTNFAVTTEIPCQEEKNERKQLANGVQNEELIYEFRIVEDEAVALLATRLAEERARQVDHATEDDRTWN